MTGVLKKWLRYLHPLNTLHVNVAIELYDPAPQTTLPEPESTAAPEPEKPKAPPPLSEEITRILKKGGRASAARINLLGVEKIEQHYGEHWTKVADKVHIIIQLILKKHMGPDDAFTLIRGKAYIMIFSGKTEKETEAKTRKIAQDIYETFFKDKNLAALGLGLEATVAPANLQNLSNSPAPLEALDKMLDQKPAKPIENKPPAKPQAFLDSKGQPMLPPNIEILFRPVVDVELRSLIGFSSVPCYNYGDETPLEGYGVLVDSAQNNSELILQLDQLSISRARLQMLALAKKGYKNLFICPVHYKTLTEASNSAVYMQFCAALADDEKQALLLEIVGIPKSLEDASVRGLVNTIKPYCKSVMARTQLDRQPKNNLVGVGVDYISLDIRTDETPEPGIALKMKSFVPNAREDRLKTFACGIPNVYLARAAAGAGFNGISGDPIAPLLKDADPTVRVDPATFMKAGAA